MKTKDTICLTMTPDVLAEVRAAAAEDGRSVSSYVEFAMRRFLAARELTR